MKKSVFTFIAFLLSVAAIAQPPAGDAKPGDFYGEKVSTDHAISIAEAAAKLDSDNPKVNTKFTAVVLDVCPNKGCWMKLAINDSTTAFVKMKDYEFFIPLAAIGKTVVIDGEIKMKKTSVAELRHYAEDAKKSKKEIAAITQPENTITVLANGVTVVQ